jgi:periplasmic protein TonB
MPVAPVPEPRLGFLRGCLVEGDSVQEARVRQNKRRALLISIAFQILLVAALVLFPLFSKGENIASRVFVPTVPYAPGKIQNHARHVDLQPHRNPDACRFCPPRSIPPSIVTHDQGPVSDPTGTEGPEIPGLLGGPGVLGGLTPDSFHQPPPLVERPHSTERRPISEPVQAAMLIRRVAPVYPPLARQICHEGRVELHAIIATDGSIQSLEVLSGDPLFIQSALAAVRGWRYRPTILDGQPVEVDTHITVVYTLSR